MLSHVQCSVTLWTVAHQAPLSMGFFRQEHWNSLPFPSPRDIPDPGIQPRSPALQADSLPTEPSGKSIISKRQRWSLFLVSKRNHFLSRRIKPFKTSLFRISWTKVTDYSKWKPDNLYSNLLRQKKKKNLQKHTSNMKLKGTRQGKGWGKRVVIYCFSSENMTSWVSWCSVRSLSRLKMGKGDVGRRMIYWSKRKSNA